MKKSSLLFVLPFLALAGCANTGGEEVDSSSSLPETSSNSYTPISFSSSIDTDTRWDKETRELMIENLGMVLPEASHDYFTISTGVDDYGDPTMWVYCFFDGHTSTVSDPGEEGGDEVIQAAITDYVSLLTLSDWTVEYNRAYNAYICDYESGSHGVEIWVLEGATGGKEALGIYAITYTVTVKDGWPTALLEKVIGKDVPHYTPKEGESLQSWEQAGDESSSGKPYVGIAVTGVATPADIGVDYASICDAAGYTVLSAEGENSYSSYLAYQSKFVAPCIYSYYDEEYTAFYIFVLPISANAFMSA